MILVIDANAFIAGFLRNSTARRLILSEKLILHSPDWLVNEFERNESELLEKFSNSANFLETKKILFKFVNTVPRNEYSACMEEASKLTKHLKDIPYFALALSLNCAIWSDEVAFKKQSKVKVYSTSELIKEIGLKKF